MRTPSAARTLLFVCIVLPVLFALAGCGDPAGEYSTPKSAATAFATAVRDGNAAKAKEASVGDAASADVLEALVVEAAAARRIEKAAEAKFGKVDILSNGLTSRPPTTGPAAGAGGSFARNDFRAKVMAAAETGVIKPEGDSARIVNDAGRTLLTLRKTAGGWKVDRRDLSAIGQAGRYVQFMQDFATLYNDTAAEIEAGKYQAAEDVREVLEAKIMSILQRNLPPGEG